MPFMFIIYLTLVLLCVAHATSTGQERYWLLIALVPVIGAVLYTAFIVIPQLMTDGASGGNFTGYKLLGAPKGGVRSAERELAMARTPENLFRYAEALAGDDRYADADVFLRELSANELFASRPKFLMLDAKVKLKLGHYREAMAALDAYRARHEFRSQTEALVLYACAYEGLHDFDSANAVYRNSVDRIGGEELRYYYGLFLARNGRNFEARSVLQNLVARVERMPRFYRSQQAPWVRKAKAALRLASDGVAK
jgi:hypothetical protein